LKHTFSAPLIKIARARKHLTELQEEIGVFLSIEPVRWRSSIAENRRREGRNARVAIQLRIVLPPEHLGAIIGDIVHNLRSALDLVACEMVRAVEGKDLNVDRVYFPFCKNAENLEDMIRTRQFHRAGERAVQVLRGLKPYHGGNAALRAIHDLDIQDKHTSLILALTRVTGRMVGRLDNDGTRHIAFASDPPETPEVVIFPSGSVLAGQEIIPTLHQLVELALGVEDTFRALANS
jgi:hypothetical protein